MEKKRKWNNILGISSVIILFATTYYSLSNTFSEMKNKPAVSQTHSSASGQSGTEETGGAEEDSGLQQNSKEPAGDVPKVSASDWNLVLVGPYNKITDQVEDSQVAAIQEGSDKQLDSRIIEDYQKLAAAAKDAGYPLVAISAFRSISYQQQVFDQSVSRWESELNLSEAEATEKAKEEVTEPGYSEHHTGLAIDVVDEEWNNTYTEYAGELLDAAYGDQPGAKWLAKNAPKYGFIIRYLKGAEEVTGITYEPWHLRYVGKDSAEYIAAHGLTLEAYLDLLK